MMVTMSFGVTERDFAVMSLPYATAGTSPELRRRRAAPLPVPVRTWAVTLCMAADMAGSSRFLTPGVGVSQLADGRPLVQARQEKSELTESELWIRLIASPSRRAMLTWR